jgi:hypothetical protein
MMGFNTTLAVAALALAAATGCGASDHAKSDAGLPLSCVSSSQGCNCSHLVRSDGTLTCNTTSVVTAADQQGYCCQNDTVCSCRVVECGMALDLTYCVCGGAPAGPAQSMRAANCNAITAPDGGTVSCCKTGTACVCSDSPCGDPSEIVPTCGLADVSDCTSIGTVVTSCI